MRLVKGDKWHNPGGYEVKLLESEEKNNKLYGINFQATIEHVFDSKFDKQQYKAYCVYTMNGKRLKLKQINPSSLEESFKMVKEKFHQLVDNCKIDEKFKQRNR